MNRRAQLRRRDGKVLWETAGLTMNPIPSPVFGDGLVFLTSGFRGNSFKAIKLDDAKGDITGTPAVAWTLDRDTPYVPSPLLYDGILYFLKSNNGLLTAVDAKTGKPHYQVQRIEGVPNVFASPVARPARSSSSGGRARRRCIKHGPTFEVLVDQQARRSLRCVAGAGGAEMYLRGMKYLYSIGS